MAVTVYNGGLDLLGDGQWVAGDNRLLLLQGTGYTVNRDDDFVADLVPGTNEVTVTGYTRLAVDTPVRTPNDSTDRIVYSAVSPDFGTLDPGESCTALVLFRFVTNDADSLLIAYFPVSPAVDTGDIDPFVLNWNAGGVLYTNQGP